MIEIIENKKNIWCEAFEDRQNRLSELADQEQKYYWVYKGSDGKWNLWRAYFSLDSIIKEFFLNKNFSRVFEQVIFERNSKIIVGYANNYKFKKCNPCIFCDLCDPRGEGFKYA